MYGTSLLESVVPGVRWLLLALEQASVAGEDIDRIICFCIRRDSCELWRADGEALRPVS